MPLFRARIKHPIVVGHSVSGVFNFLFFLGFMTKIKKSNPIQDSHFIFSRLQPSEISWMTTKAFVMPSLNMKRIHFLIPECKTCCLSRL